eukprot:scaffold6566_cov124-Isochrysis_galbana.AAC.1
MARGSAAKSSGHTANMSQRCKYQPPKKIRADYGLRQQWIDNNLTYLDSVLLELYLEEDHDYMTFTWPEYHHKHACRLGMCPNYLFEQDKFLGWATGSVQ